MAKPPIPTPNPCSSGSTARPSAPAPTPGASARSAYDRARQELPSGSVTVADVGARWGEQQSWFHLPPLVRVMAFEPDAVECARLNAAAQPLQRFYPVALAATTGPATLHLTKHPACASLYPPSRAMLDRYPSLKALMEPVGTCTVQAHRLDDWAAAERIAKLDFLKLDTQGAEHAILSGAAKTLQSCLGVEVEVMFHPLYEGQPLFADVDALLRSRGFHCWRLESLTHYMESPNVEPTGETLVQYEHFRVSHLRGSGRLVWGNAVYFRDWREVQDSRDRLVLAMFLEAAGDVDAAQWALKSC